MSQVNAIVINKLSKSYKLHYQPEDNGTHWALKDLSFTIAEGEKVALIGANGSGKSTLLKILSGVTKPSSGEVKVRGKVASILEVGAGFHPDLSGRENIFLNAQLLGIEKSEVKNKLTEIIAFSGIENWIHEPVKNYSNGMFLRLAFSIVMHFDFDVYLFDEIINVGDSEFREKTEHFFKKSTKTILVASHNHDELRKICKTAIQLSKGELLSIQPLTLKHQAKQEFQTNSLSFKYGTLNVKKEELDLSICFELQTVLKGKLEKKEDYHWLIYLKNHKDETVTAIVDTKRSNRETTELIDNFTFNKQFFRSGIYYLRFYLCKSKKHFEKIIVGNYYFKIINSKETEVNYCSDCGPLYYPNLKHDV